MKRYERKLAPIARERSKLSWEDTAREMAAAAEDWSCWDVTLADELAKIPEIPRE